MSQAGQYPEWLYSRNGRTFGPLTASQLRQLVAEQRLGPKDLVCRDGTDRWVAAGSLRGLFSAAASGSETVEQVVVQPIERDAPGDVDQEEFRWRRFGSRFLVGNVVLCAVVGMVKPPPAHVAALDEVLRDVRRTTTELEESVGGSLKTILGDIEEKQRELRENSGR